MSLPRSRSDQINITRHEHRTANVKMAQFRTPSLVWTERGTPTKTPSTNYRADIRYHYYEPHGVEFNFEAVQEYIQNLDPSFEVDDISIRSTSSIFELDSNSSISSNYIARFGDTTILVDMAVDMTAPFEGDQEEPESFPTNTSYEIGWDNQQSPHALSASVANPSQHTSVSKSLTPVTKFQQQQLRRANLGNFNLTQIFTKTPQPQNPLSIVYDIDTLLKLRQAMDGKRVELRINPAALAGKLQHLVDHSIFHDPFSTFSFVRTLILSFHAVKGYQMRLAARCIYHYALHPPSLPLSS